MEQRRPSKQTRNTFFEPMTPETEFQMITPDLLLEKVTALKNDGYRLVQIGATRLPEHIELTYSFDSSTRLRNLRLQLPAVAARVPSISSCYWCAFLYENEIHDLFGVEVDGLAVDFHGTLYKTAIKFPLGSTKAPGTQATPAVSFPAGVTGAKAAHVLQPQSHS